MSKNIADALFVFAVCTALEVGLTRVGLEERLRETAVKLNA